MHRYTGALDEHLQATVLSKMPERFQSLVQQMSPEDDSEASAREFDMGSYLPYSRQPLLHSALTLSGTDQYIVYTTKLCIGIRSWPAKQNVISTPHKTYQPAPLLLIE